MNYSSQVKLILGLVLQETIMAICLSSPDWFLICINIAGLFSEYIKCNEMASDICGV